jgi:hypothetical protein
MKAFVFAALILVLACGKTSSSSAHSSDSAGNTATPVLQLQAEIGVEFGDSNYVFGIIQDLDFTANGNIAVLDSRKSTVRVFSPDGEFLGEFGGGGEAPGEFLNPAGVACLADGRIVVTDPFSGKVEVFTEDFNYAETYSDFSGRAPFVVASAGNGFAGEHGGFDRAAGILTTSLTLWEPDSVTTFFEEENSFSPEYMVQRIMKPLAGLCSGNENLYYSAPVTEDYTVSVYPIDGSSPFELRYPDYTPVERSPEDIRKDIEAYENRIQSMAASGRGRRLAGVSYQPPVHYYATGSIGIDSDGSVWVQRGWEHNPTFDIFPPGATEPVGTVTVEPQLDLSSCSFIITPSGIAAFNPDPQDYPRIFVLTLNND